MARLARVLEQVIADWSDALASSLEDSSEDAVALCFEVGEQLTAFHLAVGEANLGTIVVPREDELEDDSELTSVASRLAAVVSAIPHGSPSLHELKSKGYSVLSRLHSALALLVLEPEAEVEEPVDLGRYDPFPEDRRSDLADVPDPDVIGGAGRRPGPRAVLFHDFDFPTAEPTLIAPRTITHRTPEDALKYELSMLMFPGQFGFEFYTKHEDAVAGTEPLSLDEIANVLMRLPSAAAVSCVFKRAPDSGYTTEVIDHTQASGPVTYPLFCSHGWNHAMALRFLEYVGASHISLHTLYRFYTSASKEEPLPRLYGKQSPAQYGFTEAGKPPAAPLHLFVAPPSSTPLGLVFVKTLTGKTVCIDIPLADTTIWEVKHLIRNTEGIPPDQQRLIFGGDQLGDAASCADYRLAPESTIHLVLRLTGD
jgi:large subunit ribosomal protein L40e